MTRKPKGRGERRTPAKPSPREARTSDQVCDMPRDNVTYGKFWMLVEEAHLTIAEQQVGEMATGKVTLTKAAFNRFVDWYNTGRWGSARKPRRKAKPAAKRATSGKPARRRVRASEGNE